jgi:MFS family permease
VWLALAATFSSLLRKNVLRITEHIRLRPWKSFFMGYLAYLLALALVIALTISVLGIPLAILGMPLLLLGAMILATAALSNMIGARVLRTDQISHRTFLYGTLALSALPGMLFLLQLITGSLVLMIFSWILIGIFIFLIVPLGLGAVLSSRFGTRDPKIPPPAPAPQLAPQVQRT